MYNVSIKTARGIYMTTTNEDIKTEDNKLHLFKIIEETADLLDEKREEYEQATYDIVRALKSVLTDDNNQIIDFKHRVKSRNSLKEKIIRRELYKQFKKPSLILASIPDAIGIMAQCKFNEDELNIYARIRDNFFLTTEDGLFYDPSIDNLFFDLSAPQPQIQKNGMETYKIDGVYIKEDRKYRFELQIRSMVNSFWSEVEHELVYKNNYYLTDESFIKDTMDTLKNNLDGIDRMLLLLSNRIKPKKETRSVFKDMGYGALVARQVSDLYMIKMKESLGYTIDFRKTCDVLGFYFANKMASASKEELIHAMFRITSTVDAVQNKETNFDEIIHFDRQFMADNQFSMILGHTLMKLANQDYEWHVFFKMLFEIEEGSNIENLELFVYVLYKTYSARELYEPIYARTNEETANLIRDEILIITAESLSEYGKIQMIYQENLNRMMDAIQWVASYLGENSSIDAVLEKRDIFNQQFKEMLRK